ncbi:MAG: NAD(P)H-dependent oxidoreductase [Muribaculaceae bacterium]|jgi:flavodoxin|nr:NAD(P)H-dependent oxidoreductase [Muribaculaceae bacterium]
MKKLVSILALALMLGACQNTAQNNNTAADGDAGASDSTAKTTLVAYFSASEAHITAQVAKTLAEACDADLFEIVPEQVYTAEDLDWRNEQSRSTIEMKDSTARPAVASKVENMAQYNTIYVGFPIWWYTAPRIINTFLEQYDLTGKTIIPFATSGGSDMGKSGEDLQKASAPAANWILPGKVLNGNPPVDSLKTWIATLK